MFVQQATGSTTAIISRLPLPEQPILWLVIGRFQKAPERRAVDLTAQFRLQAFAFRISMHLSAFGPSTSALARSTCITFLLLAKREPKASVSLDREHLRLASYNRYWICIESDLDRFPT